MKKHKKMYEEIAWESDLADSFVKDLKKVCLKGYPRVYGNFAEYITDAYMDLHWTPNNRKKDVNYLLSHPEFAKLNRGVAKKFDFDLKKDLLAGDA